MPQVVTWLCPVQAPERHSGSAGWGGGVFRKAGEIPRYRDAYERASAKHGKNIARIIVARMLLRSLFKMLKDKVRFNQVSAA